jgi:hypothetical protein
MTGIPERGAIDAKRGTLAEPVAVRLQVCFVRKVKVLFKETLSGL